MIVGFGFGSPLVSLLMLLGTSLATYLVYRLVRRRTPSAPTRAALREFYYEQRRRARDFSSQYDLTDEEIERRIDEELGRNE